MLLYMFTHFIIIIIKSNKWRKQTKLFIMTGLFELNFNIESVNFPRRAANVRRVCVCVFFPFWCCCCCWSVAIFYSLQISHSLKMCKLVAYVQMILVTVVPAHFIATTHSHLRCIFFVFFFLSQIVYNHLSVFLRLYLSHCLWVCLQMSIINWISTNRAHITW